MYLEKPKTVIKKDIYTLMFSTALFALAKIRKQLKCPSIVEWINM